MATQSGSIASPASRYLDSSDRPRKAFLRPAAVLAGRGLFSLIFLLAAVGHFSHQEIAYAAQQGVPLASIAVPLSGVLALLGGLSVLLGYQSKWGAWLLILFLVPVTLLLHNFWAVKDPMMAQMQMAMFMKNLSMIGGALLMTQFGAGPLSLDARSRR
jgi:putative oxidoreductase